MQKRFKIIVTVGVISLLVICWFSAAARACCVGTPAPTPCHECVKVNNEWVWVDQCVGCESCSAGTCFDDDTNCNSCQDCTDHNCVKKSGEECGEDSDCTAPCQTCNTSNCSCDKDPLVQCDEDSDCSGECYTCDTETPTCTCKDDDSKCDPCEECVYGNCNCTVTITSLAADVEAACVGSNVTFTVVTDPANRCECVTWSGSPSGGEGCQRTYSWGSSGEYTVTATSSCNSGSSKSKGVTIVKIENVEFSPEDLYADGVSTSTASADITPGSRTITWSIQGNALGCSINASTGVITASTTEGTITVRAADSEVSDCYAEGNIEVKPACDQTEPGGWDGVDGILRC